MKSIAPERSTLEDRNTPCECLLAGWCSRHNREKSPLLHERCRFDPRYFEIFERQAGISPEPQAPRVRAAKRPPDRGVGDTVARVLKSVGIKPCRGCGKRQEWLNRVWPYNPGRPVQAPDGSRILFEVAKGLGDAMCFVSVLRHLRELRPGWQVEIECSPWHHSILAPWCARVWASGDKTLRGERFTERKHAQFLRPKTCYRGFPSNTTQGFLIDVLKIVPEPRLCGYAKLEPSDEERHAAAQTLEILSRHGAEPGEKYPVVLLHAAGRSFANWKNVGDRGILAAVRRVRELGRVPVLIDFDNQSQLVKANYCPGLNLTTAPWMRHNHGTALAAIIERCELFVGVDSGPLHVAGGVPSTPAIGIWTGHHPVHCYNLAEHVTHLIPADHNENLPRSGDRAGALESFHGNYSHRVYHDLDLSLLMLIEERLGESSGLMVERDCWVRQDFRAEDHFIRNEIYGEDCYRLGALGFAPATIVDVGGHCGYFARKAHQLWPKARIVSVEPIAENVAVLRKNAPTAEVFEGACTYEAEPIEVWVGLHKSLPHTGGSFVVPTAAKPPDEELRREMRTVPRITLDELLDRYGVASIDLLKLDCEGSELSILENAQCLGRVRRIVGEWHDRERFMEVVARKLPAWKLSIVRDAEIGLFRLDRPRT